MRIALILLMLSACADPERADTPGGEYTYDKITVLNVCSVPKAQRPELIEGRSYVCND